MSKIVLGLVAITLLAGCNSTGSGIGMAESPLWHMSATKEDKLQYFTNQCLEFGFKYNTPEMAQCIQNQTNQSRRSANADFSRALDNFNANNQRMLDNAAANRPVQTNCRRWGNQVNCTSY
jgi:hypothetical protein